MKKINIMSGSNNGWKIFAGAVLTAVTYLLTKKNTRNISGGTGGSPGSHDTGSENKKRR